MWIGIAMVMNTKETSAHTNKVNQMHVALDIIDISLRLARWYKNVRYKPVTLN